MSLSKKKKLFLSFFGQQSGAERAIYSSRRPAHSQRNIHKYVSMASTAQQRNVICAAITTQMSSRKDTFGL